MRILLRSIVYNVLFFLFSLIEFLTIVDVHFVVFFCEPKDFCVVTRKNKVNNKEFTRSRDVIFYFLLLAVELMN